MTSDNPTRTVHFAIGRRLEGRDQPAGPLGGPLYPTLAMQITENAEPEDSAYYLMMVAGAWGLLGAACLLANLPITIPLAILVGDEAGQVAISTLTAAVAFCMTGAVYALWKRYLVVPLARRRLRKDGPESARYVSSLRRTYPRNTSLIGQAAVAIVALAVGLDLL